MLGCRNDDKAASNRAGKEASKPSTEGSKLDSVRRSRLGQPAEQTENHATVALQGQKVGMVAPGTRKNGQHVFTIIFLANERLTTGELHFGYDNGEMPEKYSNVKFENMKGLKGTLSEQRTIPFQGSQIPVRMLKGVIPLQ